MGRLIVDKLSTFQIFQWIMERLKNGQGQFYINCKESGLFKMSEVRKMMKCVYLKKKWQNL
ncbi:MAG: hypothetical protein ACLRPW_00660 [Intestinibacter sp.]